MYRETRGRTMRKLSLSHDFRSSLILSVLLLPLAAPAANGEGPRAEALISDSRPYREQTLIYTLRVHHDSSVTEINPDPIEIAGFAAEKIDGPPETTRRARGGERLVTDFRYALTPLSTGRFRIPEARVQLIANGKRRQGWNRYENVHEETELATGTLNIDVRLPPAESASSDGTWLPLHGLRIDAKQQGDQQARAGEPFQLTLTQYAWGTGGAQLPSLATALEGGDFKVYVDQTKTDRRYPRTAVCCWADVSKP